MTRKRRKPRVPEFKTERVGAFIDGAGEIVLRLGKLYNNEAIEYEHMTTIRADRLGRKLIEMAEYLREKKKCVK